MMQIANIVVDIVRDAWAAFAIVLVIITALGMLARLLQATSGFMIGGSRTVASALIGGAGVLMVGIVGLIVVPEIAQSAYQTASDAAVARCPQSSEIHDLGLASAMLIGAIGSLRMLRGAVQGVAYTAIGGSGGIASVVTTVIETLIGMTIATAAVPVAMMFLEC